MGSAITPFFAQGVAQFQKIQVVYGETGPTGPTPPPAVFGWEIISVMISVTPWTDFIMPVKIPHFTGEPSLQQS